MKPGLWLQRRCGGARGSTAWIALSALLLAGCAPAPLKPDHGYPDDWPPLIALSEGLAELNGIYDNNGVATTGDGRLVPISLEGLLPRTAQRSDASTEPDPGCENCVALRVLPPRYRIVSSGRLRFTLERGEERREFDVDTAGDANATLYNLQSWGGSVGIGLGASSIEISLTCAEDGSLVAQARNFSGILLLVPIPLITKNDYFWARFERIGELSQPPAADGAPPADR